MALYGADMEAVMALESNSLEEIFRRLDRLERDNRRSRRRSLRQKEAAEYLNRSVAWLRRETAAGRFKPKRHGRILDYDIAELDAFRDGDVTESD